MNPEISINENENESESIKPESFSQRLKKLGNNGLKSEFLILIYSSIPLILNNFSQTFLPIISLFFCGHIGPNELAAVTLANTFINIGSFSSLMGLSSACDTLFPQLFGGVDKKKIGSVLQKGLLISMLSCLPTCGILLNVKNILSLFIKEKIIIHLADTYIVAFLPSILFYSIHVILQKYVLSQNIFYPILFINILVNILNVGFHALFIFYFKLGVVGGAISVVLSNFCILIFVFLYIVITRIYRQTWSGWKVDCLFDWTEYLKLAIPGFAMLFFEWTNFEIGVIAAGKLGRDDISIMSIGIQTIYIAFMIPLGIATAANIRIGQLLGENSPSKAKHSCKMGFITAFLSSLITCTAILLGSKYIPLAFTSDPNIVRIASKLLKFLAFAHLLDALQGFGGGVIKAIGAQYYGFIMVIFSFYVIGIPIGIYLMLKTAFRVTGYWMGFAVAACFLLIMQAVFIYKIDWVKNAQKAFDRSNKQEVAIGKISPEEGKSEEVPIKTDMELRVRKSGHKVLFQKTMSLFILLLIFGALILTRCLFNNGEYQGEQSNIINATLPSIKKGH